MEANMCMVVIVVWVYAIQKVGRLRNRALTIHQLAFKAIFVILLIVYLKEMFLHPELSVKPRTQ